LISILVRLTSPGPVLFHQTRIGLDRRMGNADEEHDHRRFDCGGRPFRILKFRTMSVDDEADLKAVWAAPPDPRITSLGRFLRRIRIDELPQLFNVLLGDMNIVGPRPEQPKIFSELSAVITGYGLRQSVRPGITGLAQLNQGYDQTLDDVRAKVKWDLEYIRTQSFQGDLKIMLQTIPFLFKRRGR
jgi:lipopolysaccharide/colanic/teichoic acid biosynthesis glycosyltransferase